MTKINRTGKMVTGIELIMIGRRWGQWEREGCISEVVRGTETMVLGSGYWEGGELEFCIYETLPIVL